MAAPFKYYYQINRLGDPVTGSNIKTRRPPRSVGMIQWRQYAPEYLACCSTPTAMEFSQGQKMRYYVRLDNDKAPVSGSMIKGFFAPKTEDWQEVVGNHGCTDLYYTISKSADGTINIVLPLGVTLVDDDYTSDNGDFVLTVDDGAMSSAQDNPNMDSTDTVDIDAEDSCSNAVTVHLTINYTA